ncbi:MAG TPA: sugar transferase [Gemmatimonadaceae bacterium]|nr:sugar transferase [Gemmatimonadaceae bacterium]
MSRISGSIGAVSAPTPVRISGTITAVPGSPPARIRLHTAPTEAQQARDRWRRVALRGKRAIDIVLAVTLLLVSLPVLAFAVLAIRVGSPGHAIFRQRRVGLDGREFTMYKLRTMCHGADRLEEALVARHRDRIFFKKPRDRRVTAVGRWLRKYSIDEIPQFYNVLRGDMSLVGPRPLLLSDWRNLPDDARRRRARMRPGLTGLWQVSGRNLCADEERIRLDVEYVERWALTLDLKILLRTPLAVVTARGAC